MKMLFYILLFFEAVACIAGLLNMGKLKASYWKWFPLYLSLIIVCECIGQVLSRTHLREENAFFINHFVIPVEFLFFYWLFYQSFSKMKYKLLPALCAGVYLISLLVDTFILDKTQHRFFSFSYTVGNLLLLILIFRFFIVLITTEQILYYKNNMLFWVSCGLLLFYLGTLPYYGIRNTLAYNYPALYISYSYITYVLDCLMYLMFTFCFIWGKPNTRYLSS